MKKKNILKTLKIILGILLIFKGFEFINQAHYIILDIFEERKYTNISYQSTVMDLNEFLFVGLYIILFGAILIYNCKLILKLLIGYCLMVTTYFTAFFVCNTLNQFWLNFSLDFFNKIFIFIGMFYLAILMCKNSNFDWKKEIYKNYKISIFIGSFLAVTYFVWRGNFLVNS